MNLYLVHDVLKDYFSGMVAIKAEDLDIARLRFTEWLKSGYEDNYAAKLMNEYDAAIEAGHFFTCILDSRDSHPAGVLTQVWGGS